jgi:hypothetical protein
MSNYDKILKEKEDNDPLLETDAPENWNSLERKLSDEISVVKKPNKYVKMIAYFAAASIAAILLFLFLGKNGKRNTQIASISNEPSAIKPPFKNINIAYESFSFDANLGDTLITKNGSILVFPKNALLNAKGDIVEGSVTVKAREFNDAIDFYFSGIPMTYDSAGVQYNFASSGMIDIKAYKEDELLFVNPNSKPTINLVSTSNDLESNLYQLDTTTGIWKNKGDETVVKINNEKNVENSIKKDALNSITKQGTRKRGNEIAPVKNEDEVVKNEEDVKQDVVMSQNTHPVVKEPSNLQRLNDKNQKPEKVPIENKQTPIKNTNLVKEAPLLPQKASANKLTIEILIDPESYKELLAYNNLKFEVLDATAETLGNDSKTEWENVELLRDANGGYRAKFSLGPRSVSYRVKPVFEGKDYDKAMEVYKQKLEAYNAIKSNRLQQEAAEKNKAIAENEKIEKENAAIIAQNKITEAKNKLVEIEDEKIKQINALVEARNRRLQEQYARDVINNRSLLVTDSMRKVIEKQNAGLVKNANLIRSFEIDGFGLWNCDRPIFPNGIPIAASFYDEKRNALPLLNINIVRLGINAIITTGTNIKVEENQPHAIWGADSKKIYYITANEYKKLGINKNTKEFSFSLKSIDAGSIDISALKKLLLQT